MLVHVDRHRLPSEQARQPLDLHAEDRAADVVLVVVGDEGAHHLDTVGLGLVEQGVDAPGRVDEVAPGRRPAADQVAQVGHLPDGDLVEVEIAGFVHGHAFAGDAADSSFENLGDPAVEPVEDLGADFFVGALALLQHA